MTKKRIVVKNISKKFKIGFRKNQSALARFVSVFSGREPKKVIEVIKGVSFDINSGEIVGIIGDNGSGKSTLLRIISGIYKQDSGMIETDGKIISLLNLIVGLKDRLTMTENIELCCSLFGVEKNKIKNKINPIIEFSELREFTNTKIYQFSEGMKQRLAFSIAIHCNPEILLLDEVFEVGDAEFKKKSGSKIIELAKNGSSVVLVSHDQEMIKKYCSRIILLDNGRIKKEGLFEGMSKIYKFD